MSMLLVVLAAFCAVPFGAGCQQNQSEQLKRPSPEQCFKQLKRVSPGRLVLRQPVACQEQIFRYRLEGTPERPARITYLDPADKTRLTYRIQYGPDHKPIFEERVYHSKPPRFKVKGRTDRVIVGGTLGGEWKAVTIRTELDDKGRPEKTEKFVGADRAYSVVREYEGDRLKSESTLDGGGELKFRSDYKEIDGRRIERMVDGAGKVLMERVLDTSGKPPVQNPEIEQ
jgi:hypothetical protein